MMKQLLLCVSSIFLCLQGNTQDTLFFDQFTNASNWTLNSGAQGSNTWIVNSSYTGFPMFGISDTPSQPSGIIAANGSYAHIHNAPMVSLISSAVYEASAAANADLVLSTGVSTANYSNVNISYWYLCNGMPNLDFGTVSYSVDNGDTWTPIATHQGVTTWTHASHTIAALDGQSSVKLKFNWVNAANSNGSDPAFAIDDVRIIATGGGSSSSESITDIAVANTQAWCIGEEHSLSVSFTATGSFTSNNVFAVQLSNATGSFTNPTTIGNLTSSASGAQTITATVPNTFPAGLNYRVRVISTDFGLVSDDNGSNLVIHALPSVSFSNSSNYCVDQAAVQLTSGTPTGGTYSGTGISGSMFNPSSAGVGSWNITYTYEDANGCINTAHDNIQVLACLSISETETIAISAYPNPTNGIVTINVPEAMVEVADLTGKIVFKQQISNNKQLNIGHLGTGIYFLNIHHANGNQIIRMKKQ